MNWPAIHLRGTPQPSRTVRTWVQSTSYTVDPLPCPGIGLSVREKFVGVGTVRPGEAPGSAASTPRAVPNAICQVRLERGGRNDRQERPSRGGLERQIPSDPYISPRVYLLGHSSKPLNPLSCGFGGRLRVALRDQIYWSTPLVPLV